MESNGRLCACVFVGVFLCVCLSVYVFSIAALLYESPSGNQVDGLPLVLHTGVVVEHWQKEHRFLVKKHTLK